MEEGNGGKIAECRESSITPPVNNSEGCFFFFFQRESSAAAVCKMELSLISFSPSPSLICVSDYLDSDGNARRGGDSSPPINWKVWKSQEVRFFQEKQPSINTDPQLTGWRRSDLPQHSAIDALLRSCGPAPSPPAVRQRTPADSGKYLQKRVTTLWEKVVFHSLPVGFVPH